MRSKEPCVIATPPTGAHNDTVITQNAKLKTQDNALAGRQDNGARQNNAKLKADLISQT